MSETETPNTEQLDSGFKGCFPLLVPFVTVIVFIILVLTVMFVWHRISP
jgi:hypothetical protein